MKSKIVISIRVKFFVAFFISLLIGLIVFLVLNGIARKGGTDFAAEISVFNTKYKPILKEIKININNKQELERVINQNIHSFYIYVIDSEGKVLLQPYNQNIVQVDMEVLRAMQTDTKSENKGLLYNEQEMIYNKLEYIEHDRYVVISKLLIKNDEVQLMFIGISVFILMFFTLTYKRMKYIKELSHSLKVIAKGNFGFYVDVKGKDELAMLAERINEMSTELKAAKEKEEQVEKTKNELIINISHDLRTPLTSVIGYTKLLREKNKQNDMRRYIEIIDNKAHRLKIMIEDLFEYTLLINHQTKLNLTKVSLNELVRQVVEELMPLGGQNNINLTYSALREDQIMEIDPLKIVRVFENIISNAIKYSKKPGDIEVKLYLEEKRVVVSVYNKTNFFIEEDLDKLFDRLYRTDHARNSATGGTGIGLSVAKSIVYLHGGSIWAERTEEGITFYVGLQVD